MAGRNANTRETVQSAVQDDAHPTPISSYIGLLIGLFLLIAMIMLQAQADPLM